MELEEDMNSIEEEIKKLEEKKREMRKEFSFLEAMPIQRILLHILLAPQSLTPFKEAAVVEKRIPVTQRQTGNGRATGTDVQVPHTQDHAYPNGHSLVNSPPPPVSLPQSHHNAPISFTIKPPTNNNSAFLNTAPPSSHSISYSFPKSNFVQDPQSVFPDQSQNARPPYRLSYQVNAPVISPTSPPHINSPPPTSPPPTSPPLSSYPPLGKSPYLSQPTQFQAQLGANLNVPIITPSLSPAPTTTRTSTLPKPYPSYPQHIPNNNSVHNPATVSPNMFPDSPYQSLQYNTNSPVTSFRPPNTIQPSHLSPAPVYHTPSTSTLPATPYPNTPTNGST